MKANTPELMKFRRLQRRLEASVAATAGHLELLWIATAKNAPEGDIGRFSDEDIAIACHWDGDTATFIDALVECGWLDRDETWRLLVHDWAQHAPTYVNGSLRRHGRSFRAGTTEAPKEVPKEVPKERTIGDSYLEAPTKPSLFKPNQAISSQVRDGHVPKTLPRSRHLSDDVFLRCWNQWMSKQAYDRGKPLDPITEENQLYSLERFDTEEAIEVVQFCVSRSNCKNLITDGSHRTGSASKFDKLKI